MNFKCLLLTSYLLTIASLSYATDDKIVSTQDASLKIPRIELHHFHDEDVNLDPELKELLTVTPKHEKYYFRFYDCPINQEITVYLRHISNDQVKNNGQPLYEQKSKFSIHEDGNVIVNGDKYPAYFWFTSIGYLPGERIYCRFQTADGTIIQEINWIPIPMIAKDKNRTIIFEAELINVHPILYNLSLKGLQDGEEYTVCSRSENEVVKGFLKYPEGSSQAYCPGVSGVKGGVSEITITTKSNKVLKLHLPWGKNLIGYLLGEKIYKP